MPLDSGSLRLRLFLAAGAAVILALALAGWGIEIIFQRHAERRVVAELETDVRQLMAGLKIDANGAVTLDRTPGDQRYDQPFSGRYWQVTNGITIAGRSRSLWDETLDMPKDDLQGARYHKHFLAGPQKQRLMVIERAVSVSRNSVVHSVRAAVAMNFAELTKAAQSFRADLLSALAILGSVLLVAFALAINLGLSPLERLRSDLGTLRRGTAKRLDGRYPREVSPLVSDLNDLLDRNDRTIGKARARAADLAHGLKTPLTAITVLAQELREHGDTRTADELDEYATKMQRTVEQELSRARSAHSATVTGLVSITEVVAVLVRTMRRLPQGSELQWQTDLVDNSALRVDRDSLTEVLGNLLDNARKWARTRVQISSLHEADWLIIEIADDGPGVPEDNQAKILDRGKRLDEAVPGSGFGLSIVASVMEEIGGRIEIARADAGGLCARLYFPAKLEHRAAK